MVVEMVTMAVGVVGDAGGGVDAGGDSGGGGDSGSWYW